jgi:hypothetical protein
VEAQLHALLTHLNLADVYLSAAVLAPKRQLWALFDRLMNALHCTAWTAPASAPTTSSRSSFASTLSSPRGFTMA